MAKKKSTETSENAVVNQENKEPKKKQEDILLEMIQRYRISHTKNGIFIHIPKTNGKLEAYNLNDSRLKIKLKSMFKDEVGEFPPDAVIQNCLQYTESHAMELPLEEVKYRIASRDKSVINSVYIKRGMCLNGISPFVQKADLAERVLFFTAKLIKDTSRISDMTFWKDFSADLPYILGGIFDLYSKAMKILPTVKLQKLQRLADFHLFGYAVAEAMKTGLGKKFNEVLEDNKTRQMEITCQNAMIISLVEDFLKNEEDEGYWKGTMSLLYKSLKDFMSQQNMTEEIYNPRTYPKEANHLSRALHQYEAAFASKGIHFQGKKNSKGNMEIEITTDWLKDDIGTIKRVPIITSKT